MILLRQEGVGLLLVMQVQVRGQMMVRLLSPNVFIQTHWKASHGQIQKAPRKVYIRFYIRDSTVTYVYLTRKLLFLHHPLKRDCNMLFMTNVAASVKRDTEAIGSHSGLNSYPCSRWMAVNCTLLTLSPESARASPATNSSPGLTGPTPEGVPVRSRSPSCIKPR